MAQTTAAKTNASFFFSFGSAGTAPSALTDYSGEIISVTPGGGNRKNGEHYTADGAGAIITVGKVEPEEWVIRGVYTNGSTGLYRIAYNYWLGGASSPAEFLYAASGSATGNQYLASASASTTTTYVTTKPFAVGDAEDGSPAVFEFTVKTPTTTVGTY